MVKKKQPEFAGMSFVKAGKKHLAIVVVVLLGFGFFANYNFNLAQAKARDWERKEQVKRTYNSLLKGYAAENQAFPPHSDEWKIRGCGDDICPIEENQGTICHWGSDRPALKLVCGEDQRKYLELASIPNNPQTREPDRIRYRRIQTFEAVVEVCLEQQNDPEASDISESQIGWNKIECPSGGILIWPER